jgi:hypothetical protein
MVADDGGEWTLLLIVYCRFLKENDNQLRSLQTGISGQRGILRRALSQNILEVMVDKNICDVFLF